MILRTHSRHVPHIGTPLPGPRASEWLARDAEVSSPSYTRMYPLVAARGEGAVIEDVDGNRFLDFTAGIAVCATGHCHPRIVQAIQKQAAQLIHMSGTDFYYAPQILLAEQLAVLAPGSAPKKVFFTNSGTEAVEAAFKLARYVTKRPHMIAFFGAFHGRTMGALSLTSSKAVQRRGFAPLVPHVTHVDYPNPYHFAGDAAACSAASLAQIEHLFQRTVPPEEVAAIVVEPIQGEGGYIVPPPQFLQQLQKLADQHGILIIADEVQSGMGRTGRMFASEHFNFVPDILCTAKGIASGLPLGAIVARAELMQWPPGSHASTFGGNPVACMAALETIDLLQESLLDNAQRQGEYLQLRLRELQARCECIGDVRGMGLMVGMELVEDRVQKTPASELCQRVIQGCFQRGLLLLSCGRSTIRFCPPLVIDAEDIDTSMEILAAVFHDALRNS
jgi:4-aminobutyrate aminotransferase